MTTSTVPSPNAGLAPRPRTLSKSDFILARDCAAKLYFRENGYPDARRNDPYLAMLADGGYMVEALAKARYRDGIQLEYGRDVAIDFARTRAALERPNVTLFEATLLVGRRQARVDILEKRGNVLRVIEVKAKSFDGTEHARQLAQNRSGVFLTKKQPYRVNSDWNDKLADLTFQVVLLEQLMPGFVIQPVLALVDKSKATGLDNVPGYFELVRRRRRMERCGCTPRATPGRRRTSHSSTSSRRSTWRTRWRSCTTKSPSWRCSSKRGSMPGSRRTPSVSSLERIATNVSFARPVRLAAASASAGAISPALNRTCSICIVLERPKRQMVRTSCPTC